MLFLCDSILAVFPLGDRRSTSSDVIQPVDGGHSLLFDQALDLQESGQQLPLVLYALYRIGEVLAIVDGRSEFWWQLGEIEWMILEFLLMVFALCAVLVRLIQFVMSGVQNFEGVLNWLWNVARGIFEDRRRRVGQFG